MYKILISFIAGLLFVGCGPIKSAITPSGMFQAVNEEQAILVQKKGEEKYCTICSMDLVKFFKTSHSATYNGKQYQYCSIHCLEDHSRDGAKLNSLKVVDITSLKFIDVDKAYYVVGSNKRGTMSRISKYAFLNESDAKEFQSQYGGETMRFEAALNKAKEDF